VWVSLMDPIGGPFSSLPPLCGSGGPAGRCELVHKNSRGAVTYLVRVGPRSGDGPNTSLARQPGRAQGDCPPASRGSRGDGGPQAERGQRPGDGRQLARGPRRRAPTPPRPSGARDAPHEHAVAGLFFQPPAWSMGIVASPSPDRRTPGRTSRSLSHVRQAGADSAVGDLPESHVASG